MQKAIKSIALFIYASSFYVSCYGAFYISYKVRGYKPLLFLFEAYSDGGIVSYIVVDG